MKVKNVYGSDTFLDFISLVQIFNILIFRMKILSVKRGEVCEIIFKYDTTTMQEIKAFPGWKFETLKKAWYIPFKYMDQFNKRFLELGYEVMHFNTNEIDEEEKEFKKRSIDNPKSIRNDLLILVKGAGNNYIINLPINIELYRMIYYRRIISHDSVKDTTFVKWINDKTWKVQNVDELKFFCQNNDILIEVEDCTMNDITNCINRQ